jgi:hypothetical protein
MLGCAAAPPMASRAEQVGKIYCIGLWPMIPRYRPRPQAGKLEPIASFMTNPAGAAIVNTVGPIRQVVEVSTPETRRYLVIAPGSPEQLGQALPVQMP